MKIVQFFWTVLNTLSVLNDLYPVFDTLLLLESSRQNKPQRIIAHMKKDSTHQLFPPIPRYLVQTCPKLFSDLRKGMKKIN